MAQSNGARIAFHCPLGDEMAPRAGMRAKAQKNYDKAQDYFAEAAVLRE